MNTLLSIARWIADRFGALALGLTPILAVLYFINSLLPLVASGLSTLEGYLEDVGDFIGPGLPAAAEFWAAANWALPLNEALAMGSFLLGFHLTAAVLRVVKSFVPTIS